MKMPGHPNTPNIPDNSQEKEYVSHDSTAVPTPEDLNKRYLLPEYQEILPGLEKLREIFDLEKLKSLSTEEYIELLKKHPSGMLTHVTRQGVRDHASNRNHTAGLHERHEGFTKLLESGGFKSMLGRNMEGADFDEMVRKFCMLDGVLDRFSACEAISRQLEHTDTHPNRFADRSSVHFASSVVMNQMYGGETNNEIFFVIPSIVAGTNYEYSGNLKSNNHSEHNDVWVYADNQKGVEIDTGFCFIPKDAKVSGENGSLYENDGSLVSSPVRSEEYWERYFEKTGKKPKHVIYYDSSSSPTDALQAWAKKNGIDTTREVPELEETRKENDEMNNTKVKQEIQERVYKIINDEMPIDDAFFEKVLQYEKENTAWKTQDYVYLGVYLQTDEDKRRYENYKSEKKMDAFYESMSPGYKTLVQDMNAQQTKMYNKYLEDLHEWQEGPKSSPPPFNPIATASIPPPLPL